MKKLLALSTLFMLLAGTAFAQLSVGLAVDVYPQLLTVTAPTNDNADREKTGDVTPTFSFLSSWGTWWGNQLRLTLRYTDPDGNFSGHVRFRGDSLIRPNGGFFTNAGANQAGGVTVVDFLAANVIDQYSLTGKLGRFSGYFGNQDNRGKVASYWEGFSMFVYGSRIDHYGILMPNIAGGVIKLSGAGTVLEAGTSTYDINNLRTAPPSNASSGGGNVTYVAGTVDLNPFYVSIAGSVFNVPAPTGETYGTFSWSKGNAAIRVSGVGIANLITFDAIYKVIGSDPDTDPDKAKGKKLGTGPEPDGKGQWDNEFGVYANIAIPNLSTLGLGIGYSGYFHVSENKDDGSDVHKYYNPLYSGIDLRVKFTGLEKLTLTLHNNISFAGAKGKDSKTEHNYGVRGALTKDEEDSFFGLYTGLLATYKFTDVFTARLEAANRFGAYTYKNDGHEYKSDADSLHLELGGNFAVSSHVSFEGGLALIVTNSSTDPYKGDKWSGGKFTFGIPLAMHVVF
jgi:hypothetical protein